MKKAIISAVVAALVFALALCSCGNKTISAADFVTKTVEAIKNYDTEELSKIGALNDVINDEGAKAAKAMFSKLKCTIVESKEEGDTATVKTKMENFDFSKVFSAYMQAAMSGEFSADDTDKAQEALAKMIKESNDTITKDVTFKLKRSGDSWEITEDGIEDFTDILTGGAVSALGDMAGGLGE